MSIRIFATYLLFTFGILSNCRSDQPNVLFIAIDDMNDWTGFLGGHPQAVTPNMDRLARRSVNFTNAHCIAPACSPCRLGLLMLFERVLLMLGLTGPNLASTRKRIILVLTCSVAIHPLICQGQHNRLWTKTAD